MDVSLSAEESEALRSALQTYVSELRMEIVDTDNPEYRRGLRSERKLLDGVIDKLQAASKAAPERDVHGRAVLRLVCVWPD